jgi:hypothetical protein
MENWICLGQNRLKEKKSKIKEELLCLRKFFIAFFPQQAGRRVEPKEKQQLAKV